jgi:hypothetical protein
VDDTISTKDAAAWNGVKFRHAASRGDLEAVKAIHMMAVNTGTSSWEILTASDKNGWQA